MEKWYVAQAQTFNDGSADAKALFDYATREEALSAFFSVMASSTANDKVATVMCILMNKYGDTDHREFWERPIN